MTSPLPKQLLTTQSSAPVQERYVFSVPRVYFPPLLFLRLDFVQCVNFFIPFHRNYGFFFPIRKFFVTPRFHTTTQRYPINLYLSLYTEILLYH